MVSSPAIQNGQLHRYNKSLVAFEHALTSGQPSKHILLWIGGLGDGLHTVAYPAALSQKLPSEWSLAQVVIHSSYSGWGTGSLQRDAKDLADCVEYFRTIKPDGGKVVCMGHSTGCQDLMEYLTGDGREDRPVIDGAILQAPVSDREAIMAMMERDTVDRILKACREWIKDGRGGDVIPSGVDGGFFGRMPVSAYRWHSLLSPGGDDDYFSSDLSDETLKKSFGTIKKETPLLILYSGADQHAPPKVDKMALILKWMKIVKEAGGIVDEEFGGVIAGARHNLQEDGEEVLEDLCGRVCGFLRQVEHGHTQAGANL